MAIYYNGEEVGNVDLSVNYKYVQGETETDITELVEEVQSHKLDKNNPHGVTYDQVGAAPSGYGLGTQSPPKAATTEEANAISGTGFISLNTGIIAPTRGGWGYTILSDGGLYGTQVVYSIDGWELRRTKNNGNWEAWEWVTPPMVLGTAYRTTERWCGQVVYTKAIDFGALPNTTTKSINLGIDCSRIIRMELRAYNSRVKEVVNEIGSDAYKGSLFVYENTLNVRTTKDMSEFNGTAIIWYTEN